MGQNFEYGLIEFAVTGVAVAAPKATTSNKRTTSQNVSCEVEKMSKTVHKNEYGGCSSQLTKTQKAGEFVDKKTGRSGYKEVVKYTSSMKCEDKFSGCSSEYKTQVKVEKKVVGPIKGASKSTNKRVKYY